jgi:hypothetical protein
MLWTPAAEAISLSLYYLGRQGWHVSVAVRREGQVWSEATNDHYDGIASHELLQLVEDSLSAALRQRD